MNKEQEIEESLEFCRDIRVYYENPDNKNKKFYRQHTKGYQQEHHLSLQTEFLQNAETKNDTEFLFKEASDSFVSEIKNILLCIVIAVILALFINKYIGSYTSVDGISMENTLHDGDFLFIDKLSYHFREPERFDVIVFPFEEDLLFIKRIIGLPGETIQISDGEIWVNDEVLFESYGKETIEYAGDAQDVINLGKNEYFVLGDNRNHSEDSRFPKVGVIHKEDIVGKAMVRLYPFNKLGFIN